MKAVYTPSLTEFKTIADDIQIDDEISMSIATTFSRYGVDQDIYVKWKVKGTDPVYTMEIKPDYMLHSFIMIRHPTGQFREAYHERSRTFHTIDHGNLTS